MRRRCKPGTEYLLTIAPGDTTSPNRGSDKPLDMRKAKRVRFSDSEVDGVPEYVSLRGRRANQSPRSDAPKTSEYAYFRKLKNGAVNSHCRSRYKENKELKRSKANYLSREATNASEMLKARTDLRFSISGETQRHSDDHLFFSPHVGKHDKPDQLRSKDLTNKTKKRSLLLPENVTPVGQSSYSSPLYGASENPGLPGKQQSEKGIFSAKRDRLRQWVAQTSFPEVDKLHRKGCDLVSSLLSRLFPKGNENDDSSKGDADNSNKSLVLHDSNKLDKGLHLSHTTNWDNDLQKISYARSNEIVLSKRDTFVTEFPLPSYAAETHVQDELMDIDECQKSRITHHDFSFSLPFERYIYSGSRHLQEMDTFCSPIEHSREAPNRYLLEWDFKSGQDTDDSSIINHDNSKNLSPRLATSWDVDNVLDIEGLYPSSLLSNYHPEFDSRANYCSTSYLTQDCEPYFEDGKCAVAEQEQFSLALPYTSVQNVPHANDTIFSYRNLHWLDHKFRDAEPESVFWRKCSPTAHISAEDTSSIFHAWQFPQHERSLFSFSRLEEATGEPGTRFSEGAFNNHVLSPNFQGSIDRLIQRPLLLDNFSQFKPKNEIYFDEDNEFE